MINRDYIWALRLQGAREHDDVEIAGIGTAVDIEIVRFALEPYTGFGRRNATVARGGSEGDIEHIRRSLLGQAPAKRAAGNL